MKSLLRNLILWSSLALLAWLMVMPVPLDTWAYVTAPALLFLPAVGVWLTFVCVPKCATHRALRLGFWVVTIASWFAVWAFTMECWRSPMLVEKDIALGLGLAALAAVMMAVKSRTSWRWKTLGDALGGAVALFAIVALAVAGYEWQSRRIGESAKRLWAEIGRPMDAFEKTLKPIGENAGSEVFRQVLREFPQTAFYKSGTAAAEREEPISVSEEQDAQFQNYYTYCGLNGAPSDDFALPHAELASLENFAPRLDEAYRRILSTESPVWANDPADGYRISVPNFLGVRKFSQLAAADAMRRFSAGDIEGASRAVAAIRHAVRRMPENPTLVSLMIKVAVEALAAQKAVRIPGTGDGFGQVAAELAAAREQMVRTFQIEAWAIESITPQAVGLVQPVGDSREQPTWAHQFVSNLYFVRQCRQTQMSYAVRTSNFLDPAMQQTPDRAQRQMDEYEIAHPSFAANTLRSAMRLESVFLLREQVEIIREARERLAAGLPAESQVSVTFPACRWDVSTDLEKRTVTTRLVNAPDWVVKNAVTAPDFWVLPIDGSVAWQFRSNAGTTAAN